MKQKLLLIISCLFTCHTASSQNFILYGDKAFGTYMHDQHVNFVYAGNNQLILAGATSANLGGDKTDTKCDPSNPFDADVWLLKIDTAFNILWNKSMGGERAEDTPKLIMKANSNKIIFSSPSYSDSACEKTEHNRGPMPYAADYWICMLDSGGTKIWDKTLGGTNADAYPQIMELSTGDFLVAGLSSSPVSGDKTAPPYVPGGIDYWLIKLDSLGNKLWDKVYGGSGGETADSGEPDYAFSILPSAGTDFILAGTTDSPLSGDISDTSRGLRDIWIIKLDSAGNKIWDKRYGGSQDDQCDRIIATNDNGYILCGSTSSLQGLDVSDAAKGAVDCWVIKLDSLGNKQWDKRYGGSLGQQATWMEIAPGGGYWVSGVTSSDSSIDVTEHKYGQSDYWIFKIDSIGNKLWDKRFGGPFANFGSRFIIMPDTSIFLFGTSSAGITAVKTDSGVGLKDYWLVHFKYTDNTTGISENSSQNNFISISPNPTKGKFILNTASKTKGEIFIYDAIGKEIYLKQNILLNHFEIDISSFIKGVYFLKVKNGEDYFLKKVVKM